MEVKHKITEALTLIAARTFMTENSKGKNKGNKQLHGSNAKNVQNKQKTLNQTLRDYRSGSNRFQMAH